MGFFSAKKKTAETEEDNVKDKVERELIVHNMPSQDKIVGSPHNPESAGQVSLSVESGKKKKDVKVIGVLIIVFGFIVIGLIVFLTYRFVIAPNVDRPEPEAVTPVEEVVSDDIDDREDGVELTQDGSEIIVEEVEEEPDNIEVEEDMEDEPMNEEFSGIDEKDLPPLLDSDEDGLYDEEEILLGTSIFLVDSDGDGYSDLEEVQNNYNPTGPGRLIESDYISEFSDQSFGFSFLYPSAWEPTVSSDLIFFEESDGSLFQLALMENYDKSGILSWYENNFSDDDVLYENLISKDGLEAIISENGLNVYITNEARTNIYAFSYIPISQHRLTYINIFEMMYNSFNFFQ